MGLFDWLKTKLFGKKERLLDSKVFDYKKTEKLRETQFERIKETETKLDDAPDYMINGKVDYPFYIDSPEWKVKADLRRRIADGKCDRCGTDTNYLEIHHLHYNTLAHEEMDDLEALCKECHSEVSEKNM